MLVIIPTYKRIDSLYWVLVSIMNCSLPMFKSKPRIAIINNYPPNKLQIDLLINKIKINYESNVNWEFIAVHRTNTLPPVENWYTAVFDLALEDEVVLFVGDDDPITKTSLSVRYNAIKETNSTMVFGKVIFGLFFSNNCDKILLTEKKKLNKPEKDIKCLDFKDIWNWTAIHISNHCFVYNSTFKSAYKKAINWCNKQTAGKYENRLLFITYYLPLAILLENGKIVGVEDEVVYRGMSIEEIRKARYSIRSWNLGYISGLAYNMLSNEDLNNIEGLAEIKNHFMETFRNWYYAIKTDPRISDVEFSEILALLKVNEDELSYGEKFYSFKLLFKYHLKIQCLPVYIKSLIKSKKTEIQNW
ncbi:hypothetical protein PBAC_07260 [Pedobacter glucosidilyticus]|nr:hypothetical protein [Pedobacter glucosidilyticus]KHJ39126.1 hypothetical protein PBAC_07260 [Pedobacter glucosidilyticus]